MVLNKHRLTIPVSEALKEELERKQPVSENLVDHETNSAQEIGRQAVLIEEIERLRDSDQTS